MQLCKFSRSKLLADLKLAPCPLGHRTPAPRR
jgi:hypothetical protein